MADSDEDRDERQRRRRRRRLKRAVLRWGRRFLILTFAAIAVGSFGLLAVLKHYERDLPSTDELKHYAPPQVTRVVARDGTLLAEVFEERRTVVPIEQIPKAMKLAVLAAEDADFYRHEGLDYLGMLRALYVNLRSAKARQGGSTITQQVVKNVLLTPERTFERKARELLLARRIEQQLGKDEILELYLNHIYLGHGRYGVEEASRYYFGKGVTHLSLAEAALIAGLAKGPSIYSPRVDAERARRRRDLVLDQMGKKGFAAPQAVIDALASPLALAPATESLEQIAPEVVAEAKRTLAEVVGEDAKRGGYVVETTIDPELQRAARQAVRDNLDAYVKRHGLAPPLKKAKKAGKGPPKPFEGKPAATGHHVYWAVVTGADDEEGTLQVRVGEASGVVSLRGTSRYNPKGLPPSKFAELGAMLRVSPIVERGVGDDGLPGHYRLELGPQSAMVAVDLATREIRALVGSYEAVPGGLDRATQARRQPGSTFKPFVYSYGIVERKLSPATVIGPPTEDDEPRLLLRHALANSVNAASLWALRRLGAKNVVAWAKRAGIESRLAPTDALALGAYEVRPRELAGAYAALATGVWEKPVLVRRITGPDGVEVALPQSPPARALMKPEEVFVMTDLLTSVIQKGTGRAAAKLDLPLAGKTGTSNEARDAWFAGYSPTIACVVWTGFDDNRPLGGRESGARAALPAWIDFMRAAHRHQRPQPWDKPEGVLHLSIDPDTGLLPYEGQEDTASEYFLVGTQPREMAEAPEEEVEDIYDDAEEPSPAGPAPEATPSATPVAGSPAGP